MHVLGLWEEVGERTHTGCEATVQISALQRIAVC